MKNCIGKDLSKIPMPVKTQTTLYKMQNETAVIWVEAFSPDFIYFAGELQ